MKRRIKYFFLTFMVFISVVIQSKEAGFQFRKSSISKQNLITSSKFHWEGRSLSRKMTPAVTLQADTLRILALRAEFQTDQNDSTTGDGSFLMDSPAEPTIDPPPHDLDYFQGQLKALSNYYNAYSIIVVLAQYSKKSPSSSICWISISLCRLSFFLSTLSMIFFVSCGSDSRS